MSSPLNFELTISDLHIPNYSGPIKCALVLANFSTTVSIPCKPLNLVNVKIDALDKMYLSVFTQSSEVGCLEIPCSEFSSGLMENKYKLYENSISPEKERGQLKPTGEVYLKIQRLDDVCVRCEGLEKLVRDIKGNLNEIEETRHTHPASGPSLNQNSGIFTSPPQTNSFSNSGLSSNPNLLLSANQNPSAFATPNQSINPPIKEEKKLGGIQKPSNKNLRSGNQRGSVSKPVEKVAERPSLPDSDLKKMLEESYKARKDLQMSVSETTDQLNQNLREQREALEQALADRASAVEKMLELNSKLSDLQRENDESLGRLGNCENLISELQPKIAFGESVENELGQLSSELEKSVNENLGLERKLQDSIASFSSNNNNLNKRIQDLTADKAELLGRIEELIKQNHALKQENDRYSNLVNELCGQIALLQAELEAAKARENREKHLAKLLKEEQESKNAYKRELEALQKKSSEAQRGLSEHNGRLAQEKASIQRELTEAKKKLEQGQKENSSLKKDLEKSNSDIATLEQHLCVKEDMNSIIDQLTKQNQDNEKNSAKLVSHIEALRETIEEQAEHISTQNEKIGDLESLKAEREEQLLSLENIIDELRKDREIYKPLKDDPIDIALSDYVNTRTAGLKVQFDREDHGIYNFGTKKIFVKLEQGRLLIRVGGGYMQVEDFVKMYSPVELERFSVQKKEQAQKIRQSYLGKYADSLAVNKNKNEISPERAAKIFKDQMASGNYTPYYAVQIRSPERSSARSPVGFERISRTSSN